MIRRLSGIVTHLEEGLIALLLAAMVAITFIQVVLRYGFGTGIIWGVEATGYLFGWLVLIGASYVLKQGGHIGVDVLVKRLPRGPRRLVGLFAAGLCIFYTVIMLVGGYEYVSKLYLIGIQGEDIAIGRWILLSALPIGLALLLLRLLEAAWRIIREPETDLIAPALALEGVTDKIADGPATGNGPR